MDYTRHDRGLSDTSSEQTASGIPENTMDNGPIEGDMTDENLFSPVAVKLERVDGDEYSSELQTDSETCIPPVSDIKKAPPEDEYPSNNYNLSSHTVTGNIPSNIPPSSKPPSGMLLPISIPTPVAVHPNKANQPQSKSYVPPKIANLVKIAAPSTNSTTIKQEVDKACFRLSKEGEESLFLSVNIEKKLCSYVGSEAGRKFLSRRPDIMEHFFQFCQDFEKNQSGEESNNTESSKLEKNEENSERPKKKRKRNSDGEDSDRDFPRKRKETKDACIQTEDKAVGTYNSPISVTQTGDVDKLNHEVEEAVRDRLSDLMSTSQDNQPEDNSKSGEFQEFVSNLITLTPKSQKREKRGSYNVYSADQRAKIGKHAVDLGVMHASRTFNVRESTVRSLKKAYLKALEKAPDKSISELPKGDRGRPLVLGKYDEEVLNHVRKLQANGGIVNSWIIMSISRAVIMHRQKSLLSDYGGPIDITKTLAKSILRRFGFSKHNGTRLSKALPYNFEEIKSGFMTGINDCVREYAIPDCLVFSVYETSVPMVPGGNWTLEKEDSHQMTIPGMEDKRQITLALASSADGTLLHPQVIYKGKTSACHPQFQFPDGWIISQTADLLASAETAQEFLTNIIIPYIKLKREEMKLDSRQRALLLWDLSGLHGTGFDDVLNTNNVELLYIPPNCRDQLQPLELLVNREYKELLKSEFQSWYADIVLERLRSGETNNDAATMVDMRLSLLKPIHAAWLVNTHEKILEKKDKIRKCFQDTGILEALTSAQCSK